MSISEFYQIFRKPRTIKKISRERKQLRLRKVENMWLLTEG